MANKIKALIKGSENQLEFKEFLGKEINNVLGSEKVKKTYKKELLKEIAADVDYQKLPREKKLKHEIGKSEKKEIIDSPRKALEKERKFAAIKELDRLGMKTDENVDKINAIQFLDDKILIGDTPWAYESMKSMTLGRGTFRQETNRYYYNFAEREAEAKNQGITLPEKKDFENTLKALPGEYSRSNWYKGRNILSIILGEPMTGHCDHRGTLHYNGQLGKLGSVSADSIYINTAWYFCFDDSKGTLDSSEGQFRVVCRPLVKNS